MAPSVAPTAAPSRMPTITNFCPWTGPKASTLSRGNESSVVIEYFTRFTAWSDARLCCQQRGGDLVIITNAQQNALARLLQDNEVETNNAWVGLSYNEDEEAYIWVDGTPVTYSKWGETQPDGTTDMGVLVRWSNGRWATLDRAEKRTFLCGIPLTSSPTITMAPTVSPTATPSMSLTDTPTSTPSTAMPTSTPVTSAPTVTGATSSPTKKPSVAAVTVAPTSTPHSASPTSSPPTSTPPVEGSATASPTSGPLTMAPATMAPASSAPTPEPTNEPTDAPVEEATVIDFVSTFEELTMEAIPDGSALQATFISQFEAAVATINDDFNEDDVVVTSIKDGSVIVEAKASAKDQGTVQAFEEAMLTPENVFTMENGFDSSLYGVPTVAIPRDDNSGGGDGSDNNDAYYIIGGVVGGVFLASLGLCLYCTLRRAGSKDTKSSEGGGKSGGTSDGAGAPLEEEKRNASSSDSSSSESSSS